MGLLKGLYQTKVKAAVQLPNCWQAESTLERQTRRLNSSLLTCKKQAGVRGTAFLDRVETRTDDAFSG